MHPQGPDFELIRTRVSILELLKSFFAMEPDGELIASWRGALPVLRGVDGFPGLVFHAATLMSLLQAMDMGEVKDEYYRLFVDPFNEHSVNTNVCYYLDGRNFGESFSRLKEILAEAEIEKAQGATGSVDEIPIVIDAYQQLVEREKRPLEFEMARRHQGALLMEILLPFSILFSRRLSENKGARFYASCAHLLRECLAIEGTLF